MLSKREKEICNDILESLSKTDLLSLANTSTGRSVDIASCEDAINAIISFTSSLDEFFKRQKISKDLLINFIYKKGWPIPLSKDSKSLKACIIDRWKPTERAQEQSSGRTKERELTKRTSDTAQQPSPPAYSPVTNNLNINYNQQNISLHQTHFTQVTYNITPQPAHNTNVATSDDFTSALAFIQWFYSLLNSQNPDSSQPPGDFGPQHLWPQAEMQVEKCSMQTRVVTENHSGAGSVASCLLSLVRDLRLTFCANESQAGIQMKTDSSGRRVVIACGLLYKEGVYVGAFWNGFGLMADPMVPSTWKIRLMKLRLVEGGPVDMPSLCGAGDSLAIAEEVSRALASCEQVLALTAGV